MKSKHLKISFYILLTILVFPVIAQQNYIKEKDNAIKNNKKRTITNDYFQSRNYLNFIEKYSEKAERGDAYAEYYSNYIVLTCYNLKDSIYSANGQDLASNQKLVIENFILEDKHSVHPNFIHHDYLLDKYKRCENILWGSMLDNIDVDTIMNKLIESTHPYATLTKAKELFLESEGSVKAWELIKEVILTKQGEVLPQALSEINKQSPYSNKVNWPKYNVLYGSWVLTSCHFEADCSATSEIALQCSNKNCSNKGDILTQYKNKFTTDELEVMNTIVKKLIYFIENEKFEEIKRGDYID
jgi:hypothetical protein